MAASLHGDLATFSRTARQAYERGLRTGDQVAVCHAGTMLHRLPAGDQGPTPLLSLDELLERAEAGRRPTLVMEVLSTQAQLALLRGDIDGVLAPLSRMLLIADDIERLHPMAPVPCLMQAVIVASAVGRDEDAVRLRAYLAPIEQLLPAIIPSLAGAYAAVVADLRDKVGAARYDELTAEGVGAPLAQGNRAAQVFVRGLRPEATADSTEAQVAGHAGDAAPTDRASTAATNPALTPRELDVLEHLVSGGTNREIAEDLGLSTKTVMHHTMAIYRKLGVRGRAEAVSWALRSGTVPVR
jgi:DNA-binding CsgD family transcriptional regulator